MKEINVVKRAEQKSRLMLIKFNAAILKGVRRFAGPNLLRLFKWRPNCN